MYNRLVYHSSLPVKSCVEKILLEPWTYQCRWGTELWYKCEKVSETQLIIIFTGGQFRKAMRTEFNVELLEQDQSTKIIMFFQKDLFGLVALTHPKDIDLFMHQRIDAHRIEIW